MFTVRVNGERPDFRVFTDLLYPPGRNFDSDGDASDPACRNWTWLYLRDRESDAAPLEIEAFTDDIQLFAIRSDDSEQAALAALYLLRYCGTTLTRNGTPLDPIEIDILQARFESQLRRADASKWHRSSTQNPYPASTP